MSRRDEYLAILEKVKECAELWRDCRDKPYTWFNPDYGLCYNLENAFYESDLPKDMEPNPNEFIIWCDNCMAAWPERARSVEYPVGGYPEYQKEYTWRTMYDNPKRHRLLAYLIERAKELE